MAKPVRTLVIRPLSSGRGFVARIRRNTMNYHSGRLLHGSELLPWPSQWQEAAPYAEEPGGNRNLNLSMLDGREATRRIHAREETGHSPVVAASAQCREGEREQHSEHLLKDSIFEQHALTPEPG